MYNPNVIEVFPLNKAYDVDGNIVIKISFTSDMDKAMASNQTYLYLTWVGVPDIEANKIPCTVTTGPGDVQSSEITVKPNEYLEAGRTYRITIKGGADGIQDTLDEIMARDYTSDFTIAGTWETTDDSGTGTGGTGTGGETIPEPVPYVLSSYPRDGSFNLSPDSIRIKLSETVPFTTDDVGSKFFLFPQGFTTSDIEDLDIITPEYVLGTLEVVNTILTFTPRTLPLENDTVYSIVLTDNSEVKSIQDTIITFQSKFTDFYGDIDLIREDLVRYLRLSDSTLVRYMLDASDLVRSKATAAGLTIDWTNPPEYVHQYVRYKMQYDIVNRKYIEMTTYSSEQTLGDLTVSNSTGPSELKEFLKELRLQLKPWEDAINGLSRRGYARPVAVTKKINQESGEGYPEWIDRRFKDIEGEKE